MSNNEEIEQEVEGKVPDVAPVVDCSLVESDDDCIDLMDGEGLKKPEHIEPDEVFKEDKPVDTQGNAAHKPADKPVDKPVDTQGNATHKPIKYNKNGTARKPMTADRLEKLAVARKKALETRQRNKALKLQQKKENKIKKIVDDNEVVIVQEAPKVLSTKGGLPVVNGGESDTQKIIYEKPAVKNNKLSREEKDKKIQDAVAEGVRKALETERADRKLRKQKKADMKKEKEKEDKEKNDKLQKDKMISNQVNKLNDVDNFYDNCFNFH
jgi:hypothetical protein